MAKTSSRNVKKRSKNAGKSKDFGAKRAENVKKSKSFDKKRENDVKESRDFGAGRRGVGKNEVVSTKETENVKNGVVSKVKQKLAGKRSKHNPHRSFRRTYREDYVRDLKVPGILAHLIKTVQILAKNWRVFVPLVVLAVVLNVMFVGVLSESTYPEVQQALEQTTAGGTDEVTSETTGETASEGTSGAAGQQMNNVAKAGTLLVATVASVGVSGAVNEGSVVFLFLILLMVWLVTIYLLRQRLAGNRVKLRDGLYNAMAPVVPTAVLLAIAAVECIPIMITVILYSAAVTTEFLTLPLYALLFLIFAVLMVLLSGYMLAGSLMAMVAVSAPGLYPMRALDATTDLMVGRRMRFLIRLVAMVLAVGLVWLVVMLPMVLIDLAVKQNWQWTEGFPLVPLMLNVMMCVTVVYVAAYLYLYYRWMLEGETVGAEDAVDAVDAVKVGSGKKKTGKGKRANAKK